MFTLSNDTLSTLSAGMGMLVQINGTEGEQPLFSAANSSSGAVASSPLHDPNVTYTGFSALVWYLGHAIGEQRQQASQEGFSLNRFGATVAYCFSFYGLATFFISLILNRTLTIASATSAGRPIATSRNRYLSILRKMPISQETLLKLLRFSAVILLLDSVSNVLVVLNIMGQNYDPSMTSRLTKLVPAFFSYDPVEYASDPYMKMPSNEVQFGPTSDMLWPLYLSVAYSVFVETFASAIRNKSPLRGAGITLFELSLAIQEMSSEYPVLGGTSLASRPTEPLLLTCLFALMEQVFNQLGAVFYDNKYRLVPSTVLNTCFLWYFVGHLRNGSILSFPGEIALTYLALVLTLIVTAVCSMIFVLALITKGSRLDELNYSRFFDSSHEDYEFFSKHLSLNWGQDFYTAALNLGMVAVTSAGKSSYITEYSLLAGPRETWLDKSAWSGLSKVLNPSQLLSEPHEARNAKLSLYLRENGISGYGNVTTTPTIAMINGSDDHVLQKTESSVRVRYLYMKEALMRFIQILVWPIVRLVNRFRYRNVAETAQEKDQKSLQSPPFLRHLVEEPRCVEVLDLNEVGEDELEDNYALLLSGADFLEDDESPDYVVEEVDSEEESDVEVIDLIKSDPTQFASSESTGFSATESRSDSRGTDFSGSELASNDLMTTETLLELVQDKEVLEKHLQYEKGRMTRSLFHRVSGQSRVQDDFEKLLSLVVEKRQQEARANIQDSLDDDSPRFDHLACVVCQVEPREIITWPCKCFSICESCRLSLVAKGLEGCVCCRRDVEGVSRVFLP